MHVGRRAPILAALLLLVGHTTAEEPGVGDQPVLTLSRLPTSPLVIEIPPVLTPPPVAPVPPVDPLLFDSGPL